jgi:hypothetical protein
VSLLEELGPANMTVVARPFVDEEGIVRVAVIKAGALPRARCKGSIEQMFILWGRLRREDQQRRRHGRGSIELIEAYPRIGIDTDRMHVPNKSARLILGEANDSKPAESSERICPFGCVIWVSCGEIAVPCHNDQLGIVTG